MRHDYVDLKYEPKGNEILCMFYVEPAEGYTLKEAATHLAGESSIDTWSDIVTLSPRIAKELKPHVYYVNPKKKIIKIAYHLSLFELGSIPQLLSSVAGNIYGMKLVKNLRLLDIRFPKAYVDSFLGPLYGLNGVRQVLEIKDRPLLGTIVKPKVGLTSEQHAKVAYDAWLGGLDIVKDDENLTNQDFNDFETRVKLTLKARKEVERKTGAKKGYMANISAATVDEMVARAKIVKKHGGRYAMIDIVTVGFTGLQSFRKENEKLGLIIHAHRAMHAALTRNPYHGMTMLTLAKLARLAGVDQLHIGTVVGKMAGDKTEVLNIRDNIVKKKVEKTNLNFAQNWYNIKPVFPVASGGLNPVQIPELYKIFGKDVILQFGGGVHAHPEGTLKGAKACRDALDATLAGISLKVAAKKSKELALALKKWG